MGFSDLAVDIWFHYGSFSYGLEGMIVEASGDDVSTTIVIEKDESSDEVCAFLSRIIENPKSLMHTEIRIFNFVLPKTFDGLPAITLITHFTPRLAVTNGQPFQLLFFEAQGVSDVDKNAWSLLKSRSVDKNIVK